MLRCYLIQSKVGFRVKHTAFAIDPFACGELKFTKLHYPSHRFMILCFFDVHVVTGPPPEMLVECDSTWSEDGMLEAHVSWSLPNSTQLLEAIEAFRVMQQPDSENIKHIATEV